MNGEGCRNAVGGRFPSHAVYLDPDLFGPAFRRYATTVAGTGHFVVCLGSYVSFGNKIEVLWRHT